ncbi:siphovirus Gp157 family protein [Parablautia sp. Marseille-Q6255]|uniref:siphovirus Gp157 family protein n=1 Tax=Parablautia sp. Marseille-Q6255 TaxID=3039593 RepID=UPI0024BD4FA8|nr:siphovirus Gp157 family protein [Parablautia sp. Marseille-Q6255]
MGNISLYELTEQYDAVLNMLYDGETDEQTIMDTLESIEGEIEDKADNYAKLIRIMQTDAELLKKEEDRLAARRRSLENRSGQLKQNLQANLEFIGKTKFKTALFSFSVATNGGLQPLTITDNIGDIPGKYLIPQPPVPDKDAIRNLLAEKDVEWAHLEPRGKSLRIR